MANLAGFDARTVEPAKGFDPVPAGKYIAIITESEMKATSSGNGQYLNLKYEIIDGPHKGRVVFSRHNLDNPNEQAVQIAKGELSSICRAVNILAPNDSEQLHNIPIVIKIAVKKRNDNGELTNDVKGWEAKGAATTTAPAASGSAPPWARGAKAS